MDYLDPKKQRNHKIILLVGYVLVAIGIGFGTVILLYEAYGFGLTKGGQVIQNDLVYISSQPNPAQVYLNGTLNASATNTRLSIPSGVYTLKLSRTGYRDWQRSITLNGGDVENFDYPLLFPKTLDTSKIGTSYSSAPGLVTQSPDRRWLLVEQPGSMTTFDVYDIKDTTKAPTVISLPATLLTKATGGEKWQVDEWADDNQHVLLEHDYDGKSEYILVDRANPDQSVNLNTTLASSPTRLTLNNKKYDQYYLYNSDTEVLRSATLKPATVTPLLDHVLAYQSYGNNSVLYITDTDAPTGKVLIKLTDGNQTYVLHNLPTSPTYVLDLTQYNGTLYVAAGASSENKVYIYADPIGQLSSQPSHVVAPVQVLHVTDPDYVSFSANAQFIMAEHGTQFGTYDIKNKIGYNYTLHATLDAPQAHATWMDGDRLAYVSGGKLEVLDYDAANQQSLMSALPQYVPIFSPSYNAAFSLTGSGTQVNLDQTYLLTVADR